jgi:ferritin-like metal-binding protein YciE
MQRTCRIDTKIGNAKQLAVRGGFTELDAPILRAVRSSSRGRDGVLRRGWPAYSYVSKKVRWKIEAGWTPELFLPVSVYSARTDELQQEVPVAHSKDIKTFQDLYLHTLQDIYYAENQITKALPKMIKKATDAKLKHGFETHLKETEGQIKRLEEVFKLIGHSVKAVDCPAIDGIIKETNEVAGEIADKKVLDAALIAAAQAVEHYEITRYGTLVAWSKQLGLEQAAGLLHQNLAEEEATDKKLTAMSQQVNLKAA